MGPAKAAVSLAGNVLINAAFGDKIDAIKENAAVGMTAGLRDEDKKYVQEEHDYAKQQYAAGEDGYLDGDGGVLASRFLIELAAGEIGALTKKVAGKAVGVVSGGPQGSGPGAKSAGSLSGATATSDTVSQLAKNKAAGEAFEVQTMNKLQETQTGVVQQVTVKTQSGTRTRIDLMGKDAEGNIVCTECKASATAPLTTNQKIAFPEIKESGAVVVGKGKPGFPGGTQIPPTTVDVVRP